MEPDLSRRPRSGKTFTDADMGRLRDLYYDPEVSVQDVARAFGVPASTLLRWLAEMGWPRRTAAGPRSKRAVWQGNDPVVAKAATLTLNPSPHDAGACNSDAGKREGKPQAIAVADGTVYPEQNVATFGEDLAARVRAAARAQIEALGDPLAPGRTPAEQLRRANLVASLSRTVDRIERALAVRQEMAALRKRVRTLEKERRDAPKVAEAQMKLIKHLLADRARQSWRAPRAPHDAVRPNEEHDRAAMVKALTERFEALAKTRDAGRG